MFKLKLILLILFFSTSAVFATTNTWDGSFNSYWHNLNNWSLNHIPTASEDVVITTAGNTPSVNLYNEACNSLTINSGATLNIYGYTLDVTDNVNIYGNLNMNNTASQLYAHNVYWESGSTASMTGSATIHVDYIWEFKSGCNVYLNSGFVNFEGTGVGYIRALDNDSYFNHIRAYKSSNNLSLSSTTTQPCVIKGNMYIFSGCGLRSSEGTYPMVIHGFINNMGGNIQMNTGTVEFAGGSSASTFVAGDYFYNLTINSTGTETFNSNIEIKNDLTIQAGTLSPGSTTITIGNDWTNTVGTVGFTEGTSRVIFNGLGPDMQYIHSNESFATLENNTVQAIRINSAITVDCDSYDWTSGSVSVAAGTFIANDLFDNGVYGNYYALTGSEIYLYQDTGQFVDVLSDIIYIHGNGLIKVIGGSDESWWCTSAPLNLEISTGGVLDFDGSGITIKNSYMLTEDITDGSIKTSGWFTCERTDFNPGAGTIELYGGNDVNISMQAGSNFYDVLITKSATENEADKMLKLNKGERAIVDRDGTAIELTRANTVNVASDLDINGNLQIDNGTFDLNGYNVNIVNGVYNYGNLVVDGILDAGDDLYLYSGSNVDLSGTILLGTYAGRHGQGLHYSGSTFNQTAGFYYVESIVLQNGSQFNGTGGETHMYVDGYVLNNNIEVDDPDSYFFEFHVDTGTDAALYGCTYDLEVTYSTVLYGPLDINSYTLNSAYSDVYSGGEFIIDSGGTVNVTMNGPYFHSGGSLTMNSGSELNSEGNVLFATGSTENVSGGEIFVAGSFTNVDEIFSPTGGSFTFDGSSSSYIYGPTAFFDLNIAKTGANVYANSSFSITDDLVINSGVLDPDDNTIEVGGDWTNNIGDAGFVEGSGRVIFNGGNYHQYCTNETFNELEVNKTSGGSFRINTTTVICNSYDWESGSVDVNTGTFTALDLADNGLYGSFYVNPGGTINLHQDTGQYINLNGNLTFTDGGTINVYGGSFDSYWPYAADASITMSGGVLDFKDSGIYINNSGYTLTEDITGGTIRTAYGFTGNRTDFNPAGGTIELYGTTDASLSMGAGSNFYDVEINKSTKAKSGNSKAKEYVMIENRDGMRTRYAKSNTITLTSDCVITNELAITEGALTLNGAELTVAHDCHVYGTLTMNNPADIFNIGTSYYDQLNFYSGSTADLSNGIAHIYGWVIPSLGCSFTATTDNTIIFSGNTGGGPSNLEPTTTYGNIEIYKNAGERTFVNAMATQPIIVNGNFTVHPDNEFELQSKTVIVHGTLSDQSSSEIYVWDTFKDENAETSSAPKEFKYPVNVKNPENKEYLLAGSGSKGGSLEVDTDFTLNGLMDVGDGDVLLHSDFHIASTGTLDITTGSVIADQSYHADKAFQCLDGTINLTDGLFEISHNSMQFGPASVNNISGGVIRCGFTFHALDAGVFQPTDGIVEFTGDGYPRIECNNGNYFYNLLIDRSEGIDLWTDIEIKNDFQINSGPLRTFDYTSTQYNLYVEGDWTNNGGDVAFEEGTGTVIFNGNNFTDINTDETFYNLTVDKTIPHVEAVEIQSFLTVNVTNDLNIINRTLEMNTGSTLNIGNDLNIALNAGLNANLDTGLNISIEGDWTNNNVTYDSYIGFSPGTSTVTFNGSYDQLLTTQAPQEDFGNLVIDKSGVEFRSNDNIRVMHDLDILSGGWHDNASSLTHYFEGDFYITAGTTAYWNSLTGNTVVFKGLNDQTVFNPIGFQYFYNIVVDKTAWPTRNFSNNEGAETNLSRIDNVNLNDGVTETRALTVSLASGIDMQFGSGLTVEEGTLDLNGMSLYSMGNVIINDGGTLIVDEGAFLKMKDGNSLLVNSGGKMEVLGTPCNLAAVTHRATGNYTFKVYSGGTISAEYATFEYMSANGVNVKDGAIIDATHPFDNCIFREGIAGGTLLTVNNNQILTVANANFPTNTWSGASNVSKTQNQGHVEFFGATGDFAGPTYENDVYGLIDWTGFLPDLTITNAVWSDMNPYVCDMIDVAVTVKNIGSVDVTNSFWVDLYYNLPSPPSLHELGDQWIEIAGLPAGDSLIVNFYNITSATGIIWSSYVQVDADSNIAESDENNNVWGPDAITWNALPSITDLTIHYTAGNIELDWTYPATADSFYIYRDTDPYFIPVYGTPYASVNGATTFWSEPVSDSKYFYIVTAFKDEILPVKNNANHKRNELVKRTR